MSTQTSQNTPDAAVGPARAGAAVRHHKAVVVGGGTGGITAVTQLCRKVGGGDVAIGRGSSSFGSYDGYASCPLTTGYGKLVGYDLKPAPSFPFDTTKERWSMYQLKVHGLPRLYWNGMLKGRG